MPFDKYSSARVNLSQVKQFTKREVYTWKYCILLKLEHVYSLQLKSFLVILLNEGNVTHKHFPEPLLWWSSLPARPALDTAAWRSLPTLDAAMHGMRTLWLEVTDPLCRDCILTGQSGEFTWSTNWRRIRGTRSSSYKTCGTVTTWWEPVRCTIVQYEVHAYYV